MEPRLVRTLRSLPDPQPGRPYRPAHPWCRGHAPRRPARPHAHRHAPTTQEILQTVHVDPITVCLLDTRTRRTRRLRHPQYSQFVDEHYMKAMLDQAANAEIFVLATPQPLLSRASWPKAHMTPEHASPFDDVNMWDYWHQWQHLWTELVAVRDGRPTVTIGGDIHQSYIAFAPELSIVEVVSSPMSLVWGGGVMQLGTRITNAMQLALRIPGDQLNYQPGQSFLELPEIIVGPDQGAQAVPATPALSVGCLKKDEEGFARLTFEETASSVVTFTAELFRRDDVADLGITAAAVTGRYTMHLGAHNTNTARSVVHDAQGGP